jgi:hypothetical protein
VQKYQGRPFVLLGVNEDENRGDLQKAEKQYHLNWRSWWDGQGFILREWRVEGLPTFVLIDHKGIVRWRSPDSLDLKEMEALIERLVKQAESEGGKLASRSRDR